MTVRKRYFLAAAAGLWMALPLPGQEPARLEMERGQAVPPRLATPADQNLADSIADHLRQSGQLHNYRIDINVNNGAAELTGSVVDQPQREEALRLVQGVPGVERVRDNLTLSGPIAQVQGQASAEQGPPPRMVAPPPGAPPVAAVGGEPVPIYQAPTPGPYDLNPPRMPPYSWPTYAPYNNYSRVATPLAYPYQSFPFIGPCYPFPKVPLGWRSVQLRWEDGHWWYSKVASPHDWWRLRYW
ncbi:MAG TPA: BON domain-containing protein [Gemmataceae bacterium]|nr:BON domain-containing protein [Gemmataceae bacterium]